MVQIQITIDGSKLQFNLLSREDATPEEYEVAKHMQDLHLSIIQSAGVPVKITEVEDKRARPNDCEIDPETLPGRYADDMPSG